MFFTDRRFLSLRSCFSKNNSYEHLVVQEFTSLCQRTPTKTRFSAPESSSVGLQKGHVSSKNVTACLCCFVGTLPVLLVLALGPDTGLGQLRSGWILGEWLSYYFKAKDTMAARFWGRWGNQSRLRHFLTDIR